MKRLVKIGGALMEIVDAPLGDGKKPVNPSGMCFDLVGFQAMGPEGIDGYRPPDLRICHGIGWTNFPGKKRKRITHAWLEFRDKRGLVAFDVGYMACQSAEVYRRNFKSEYVVEYTFKKFMENWAKYDFPGPWDSKLKKLQRELDKGKK